jgi:hypothetical protein
MNHTHQLTLDAQFAVYVMSNPDASEIEFLELNPRMASVSEMESLAARWPGRGLRGIGVIGLVNGRVHMALTEPCDNIKLAALLGAFSQYRDVVNCADDSVASVAWCERLYAWQDPRMN